MSLTDSLTRSASPLPADGPPPSPAAIQDRLDDHIDRLQRLIEDELRRIAADTVAAVIRDLPPPADALTAAAGDDALADAAGQWQAFVTTDLDPLIGQIHLEGSLTAYLGSPVYGSQASTAVADLWTPVVNEAAVDYARQASNRLVGVGDGMWQGMRTRISRAVASGEGTEALHKDLRKQFGGMSEFRADTIARTEVVGAFNNGDHVGAQALGPYGPVEKQWLAAGDVRTRPSHAEADGQVVAFADSFDVGGVRMPYPHAPGAPAGEVVNCRCVVLHLYAGDTRPDGTIVGEHPDAPPPLPEQSPYWTPDEVPHVGPLNRKGMQPTLGGVHEKVVYVDSDGNEFLFKPMDEHVAHGEVAGNEVSRLAGLDAPRMQVWTDPHGRVGTLQEMVPGARNAFPGSAHDFDPLKVSKEDLTVLQQHRAVDWVISNHDGHAGQFIRRGYAKDGGKVIGVDKGQAFKFFGKDKLAYDYAPNAGGGFPGPVHNVIERAYRENRLGDGLFQLAQSSSDNDLKRTLRTLHGIDDDEYRRMWRKYAEGVRGGPGDSAERLLDQMVDRKNGVEDDFVKYHRQLYRDRLKVRKATELPKQKPLVPGGKGGPKGFAGAPVSKSDKAFMAKHDSPAAAPTARERALAAGGHVSPAPSPGEAAAARKAVEDHDAMYQYTQSSYGINSEARAGRKGSDYDRLRQAMHPIKNDMIVHRGTTIANLPGGYGSYADLQGTVFQDRAFLSTSAGGKAGFTNYDAVFHIRATDAAKGRWVEPISAFKGGREQEFLLDADTPLFIHSVRAADQSVEAERTFKWVIEAETVDPAWVAQAQGSGQKVWDSNLGRFWP